jgi:hypothetical protein
MDASWAQVHGYVTKPPGMDLVHRGTSSEVVACSSDCSSKVHVLHNLTGH